MSQFDPMLSIIIQYETIILPTELLPSITIRVMLISPLDIRLSIIILLDLIMLLLDIKQVLMSLWGQIMLLLDGEPRFLRIQVINSVYETGFMEIMET